MAQKWKQQPLQDNCKVFFRIILPFTLQQNKLSLPLKFLKKYGNEFGNQVKLRVPDGRVWKIRLTKENNAIYLSAGLKEFFRYYAIRHGHFLVFKYKGMSNFSVCILDRSTCQIEYPNDKEDEFDDDKSIEILCSNLHPSSSKGQLKKKRVYKRASCAEKVKFQPEKYNKKDGVIGTKRQKIVKSIKFDAKLSKMSRESKKAAELAMNSKPKNPSFVVLVTKHTFVNGQMFVPSPFASAYMCSGYNSNEIKIVNSDGEEWTVHTAFIWRGRSLRLEGGWNEFYGDNCLEEGDVCVFELVQMCDIVLKVSIFRGI